MDLQNASYVELERAKYQLLYQLGAVDTEIERRRDEKRYVMKQSEQQWIGNNELHGTKTEVGRIARLISPELGFPVYTFRAFLSEIPPHQEVGAYHRHGEAIKYYLRGKGKEIIGDQVFEVEAGDAALVPAGIWHGTQNPGDEPLRFLAVLQLPGTSKQLPTIHEARKDLM